MDKNNQNEIIQFYEQMREEKSHFCELNLNREDYVLFSQIKEDSFIGKDFPLDLEESFFTIIDEFSFKSKKFYHNRIGQIPVARDPYLKNGFAYLEGNSFIQKIYIPGGDLKEIDFISYAHELGHLPTLIHPNKKESFEYLETFPMFLEYLSCIYINHDEGYDQFLKIMRWMIKEISKSYLKYDSLDDNEYHFIQKKDHQKYLYSLDCCIQLIHRYLEDKNCIYQNIDDYIYGKKSMRKIAKELDITTSNCKVLKKVLL